MDEDLFVTQFRNMDSDTRDDDEFMTEFQSVIGKDIAETVCRFYLEMCCV